MISDLKGLEALLWIARKKSFSEAARHLSTTQPAISMRIIQLERKLGTVLIDRSRGGAKLTRKGNECAAYAERIFTLVSHLEHSVADLRPLEVKVRIGVSESIAVTWLSMLVTRVNREYPKAILEIDVSLAAVLWSGFVAGDYDVVLVPEPTKPVALGEAMSESLGSLGFDWMASPRLKLPRGALTPRQLEDLPIITLAREAILPSMIESWFQRGQATPRFGNVCNSMATMASLTMAGVGISLLPPTLFADAIRSGHLARLNTAPRMEPLRFWAVCPTREFQPLAREIARLAQATSTFQHVPVEATGSR